MQSCASPLVVPLALGQYFKNEFSKATKEGQKLEEMADSQTAKDDVTKNSSVFPCHECDETFDSSKALRVHVAQHKWGPHRVIVDQDGTKFQCLFEGCGKLVKDRKVLRKHCLTHRPREFACDDCGKRFYERAKLKRHMLVHSGEKDFTCTFENCNKQFAYKANLLTHMRTHTGHRPYKCSWPGCGKSFAQASNRNSHVLTHSQSKRKRSFQSVEKDGNEEEEEEEEHNSSSQSEETEQKSKKTKVTPLSEGIVSRIGPSRCGSRASITSEDLEENSRSPGSEDMTLSPSHSDAMAVNAILSLGGSSQSAVTPLGSPKTDFADVVVGSPTSTHSRSSLCGSLEPSSQQISGINPGYSNLLESSNEFLMKVKPQPAPMAQIPFAPSPLSMPWNAVSCSNSSNWLLNSAILSTLQNPLLLQALLSSNRALNSEAVTSSSFVNGDDKAQGSGHLPLSSSGGNSSGISLVSQLK